MSRVVQSLNWPRRSAWPPPNTILREFAMPIPTFRRPLISILLLGSALFIQLSTPAPVHARVKLITLPVRERVEIQLDNAQRHAGRGRADRPAGEGREPGRLLLGQHADRSQHDRLPRRSPPWATQAARREGAVASAIRRTRPRWSGRSAQAIPARPACASATCWAISPRASTTAPSPRTTRRRSTLSQYMRLQNFANEEFGSTGLWAGFGKRVPQADRPQRDQGNAGRASSTSVPIAEDLHLQPAGVRLPRPAAEQAPRADALRAQERQGAQPGRRRPAVRQGPDLHRRRRRGCAADTAFLGEDWGKFTPMDDEMRLYLGVAQDIVVKRTIDKNEAQPRRRQPVRPRSRSCKYEIENFKDQPVTLDIVENLRHIRNEVRGDTGRDVAVGARPAKPRSTASPTPSRARSTSSSSTSSSPPRRRRQGREDRAQAAPHLQERVVIAKSRDDPSHASTDAQ